MTMPMSPDQHRDAARSIVEAERTKQYVDAVSTRWPAAGVDDAYAIALAVRDLKLAAGSRVVGHKVGLTSSAMREMFGATEPDYGFLYDDWIVAAGATVPADRLNRALVEQEVAFVLGRPLTGAAVTAADVIAATDVVVGALEVVDSRFNARGPNMLVDSISDGASCGFVVLGDTPVRLASVDVTQIRGTLYRNGAAQEHGVASAVLGDPVNAVAWLANTLHRFGVTMEAGDVILSGSFIRAVTIEPGDTVTGSFDHLGDVTVTIGPADSPRPA
jgi:2-oxo-hept-3-ene-1,7-dioate hydratase